MPKNYHTPITPLCASHPTMLRYAITSGEYGQPGQNDRLLAQVHRLAEAGVEYLQLREKHLPAGRLASLAREILAILAAHDAPTRLLINSRPDVALATGAHGVHLTSGPCTLTPAQVRILYARQGLPEPTISKACHTLNEITSTQAGLILFSPIFGKGDQPGVGLKALREACAQPIPVLALGGVTPEDTTACLEAGAAGVAGIRLFHP